MFPISYSTGISRYLSLSVLLAVFSLSCWTAVQNINAEEQNAPISWVGQNEQRLQAKAIRVVERFTDLEFSVDLSVAMDHSRIETSSYQPGETPRVLTSSQETSGNHEKKLESVSKHRRAQNWELTGTWQDSVNEHPRISSIQCCITVSKDESIDEDHLFRCLSTSLGLDLSRGDILKIVAI